LATAFFSLISLGAQAQNVPQLSATSRKQATMPVVIPEAHWLFSNLDSLMPMPENLQGIPEYCEAYDAYTEALRPKPAAVAAAEEEAAQQAPEPQAAFCDEWVAVNEDTYIKAHWLNSFDYYAIWDSQNLNSYGYDLKSFTEPVTLRLYNEDEGESWHIPVNSLEINSKFGHRRYRWHHGLDIDLEVGMPIYATFDGVVRIAKYNRGGYGYYVLIRHKNGLETLYGHLQTYYVKEGQEVKAGQVIGLGGNTGRSTGPHLHFEARYRGHAFDPSYLFDFDDGSIRAESFVLTPQHYERMVERLAAKYHRVRRGDTLGAIAHRYGTSVRALCQLNGISKRTVLRIGRSVRVR
jgi:murein DD-endopeptidase MepM/ murein hydrolase activator NlpD